MRHIRVVAALAAVATLAARGSGTSGAPAPISSSASSSALSSAPVAAPPSVPVASPRPTVVAQPKPKPNPCRANRADQLVLVKLRVQHMWLCHRTNVVESNAITSGMTGPYTRTPTGRFHIQGRNRDTVLTLNTGAQYDVKYWIPFNAPLFGFHDSSWQKFPYGSSKYRTAGSHGCVHMPLKAIAFLYHWADIGADVSIS